MQVISPTVIRRFKENAEKFIQYDISSKDMTAQEKIEHVLRTFSVVARIAHTFEGYSSNTYLLEVSAGVMVSSIYKYKLDIANALNVPTVRFSRELVVRDGRSYLAIEFAKARTKSLVYEPEDRKGFQIPVGKDNYGNIVVWDLENHSTPHALVCGATGSGKSVFLKSTMYYALEAGVDEVYILDPKYEFTEMHDHNKIFVYNDILEIEDQMANLVLEMEELVKSRRKKKIMIVFDEFADAVANSRKGKELDVYEEVVVGNTLGAIKTKRQCVGQKKSLEENLRVLLQKGRSSGFRIIAATQRASVKVITGDAKVNFPVQICFRVPKATDSQVVIDEAGAEGLAGMGDGLLKSPQYNDIVRFQAYYKP
jgi:S-DNA-T family DNA segregation ATPase FtsK/SpoIIIE